MSTGKNRSKLDIIKNVDDRTRCIVFGFVRSVELSFVTRTQIPSEIVLMCLLYYYNPEYFTVYGSHMILKDNGHTVESDSQMVFGNTAYGNIEINKNDYIKCIWDFEIKKCDSEYNTMVIGIAINKRNIERVFVTEDLDEDEDEDEFEDDVLCGYNYGYYTDAFGDDLFQTEVNINKNGDYINGNENPEDYGCDWKVGDIITMELDIQNKTLKYYVNSIDQGIAVESVYFDNNVKYVMAVACEMETIIKLINFQATHKI